MVMRFDLPFDLIEEILSRVPTTSLRRLRFTCKRWNALFKDPEFIKNHLDKAPKTSTALMLSCFRVYSLSVNINAIHNTIAFDPSIEFAAQFSGIRNESKQILIFKVIHCNGLLLLCCTNEIETKFVVVNPCTGQTRWIEAGGFDFSYVTVTYALGYEYNNKSFDNYKILIMPSIGNKFGIYKLKSNSWKVLNIIPYLKFCVYERGVSLKGNTYWLSFVTFDILSFDFTTEKFKRLCLPVQFQPSDQFNTRALSVFREEQLSVLRLSPSTLEIWVSNKIDTETELSWSKSFEFNLHSHVDQTFLRSMSFFIDEEKKVIVCCGRSDQNNKDMIYIVGEHGYRKFDDYIDQSNNCPLFLFSYVPSLLSLNPPM